ncbi:MAG TPA: ThuA domain-containing protein, partial [Pirellulaceae bacterium]|nr:ThuA domain-containing protein [Pirellulaceae bacterium]
MLGRPFGLRQMVRGGRKVVLMRDMTDCMYNPARWPYVSHYTGNDLIVRHVEQFICSTISSDQILGGREFRFAGDRRPTLAIVIAEDGYQTDRTLPEFALNQLGRDFRVTFVHGAADSKTEIPGLEALDRADAAIFSVRRRVLKPEHLAVVRRFVESGKPVIGLRTASHAWSLRDEAPPAGLAAWPEFDKAVTGAKYLGHPLIDASAELSVAAAAEQHPILRGVPRQTRSRPGSLYQFGPLAPSATLLVSGVERTAAGATSTQPVAWAFHRLDGGRSFYTSLGEPVDFQDPSFVRLLNNAVTWCAGLPVAVEQAAPGESPRDELRHWTPRLIPDYFATDDVAARVKAGETIWLRAVVRAPLDWRDRAASVVVRSFAKNVDAWW